MQNTHAETANNLLTVNKLDWHVNRKHILNNISFEIKPGSFNGLLGPNGAGKSSLLRCLYRYLKPTSGCIKFNGKDIWQFQSNDYAKNVAVVLQETPGYFNLTVFDVVALGLIPHKSIFSFNQNQDRQAIFTALEQVGMLSHSEQNFEHLSGGEKQRVLIARAIVQSPTLLIMDEPTSHLDVKYQIQIMTLAKSLGVTVLASFHDLNLASAMCDNILLLKEGKLIRQGTPAEVFNKSMLSDVFGVDTDIALHPRQNVPHITYYYESLVNE